MFERYHPEKEGLSFLRYVADMEGITEKRVDLVNFNTANPLLRHQIIKYGKLLTDNNTIARVELMVKAMVDYEEYQLYLDFGIGKLKREMGIAEKSEWDEMDRPELTKDFGRMDSLRFFYPL